MNDSTYLGEPKHSDGINRITVTIEPESPATPMANMTVRLWYGSRLAQHTHLASRLELETEGLFDTLWRRLGHEFKQELRRVSTLTFRNPPHVG